MMQSVVAPDYAGGRIDRYIAHMIPDLGLRGARRAIADGSVKVNSSPVRCSRKLKNGDLVEICRQSAANSGSAKIIAQQGDYLFLYKPRGLHTVALAGSAEPSLESALAACADLPYQVGQINLLQRLDFNTSGIVCAAATQDAASKYREWETRGLVEKEYLAILTGEFRQKGYVKNLLDADNRKHVRILPRKAPADRWTYIEPLQVANGLTLALCKIKRGQRHQIRVHAAAIGHALAGDGMYGGATGLDMMLICREIKFPGHRIRFIRDEPGMANLFPDAAKILEPDACYLAKSNSPNGNPELADI